MIASLNAIIRVTNCKLTPRMFADNMKSYTKNFTIRQGLFHDNDNWSNDGAAIIAHYMNDYKVNYKSIEKSGIKPALQAGHAVIALGARYSNDTPKVFSKNGHYVAFVGMSGDNIIIKNPASSEYSNVSFTTATTYGLSYWEVWKWWTTTPTLMDRPR